MNPPTLKTDWPRLHGSHFKDVRVLITGGAGFIGSHLTEALCTLGAKVVVLDDLTGTAGSADNLRAFPPGAAGPPEFVQASILDTAALAKAAAGARYVFHLAALGSVPMSVREPRRFHEVNSTGTLNVLEAAREAKAQRLMFAASSSAYGDSEVLPKVETMPPAARSPYAANKLAGEALLSAYPTSYGLDTVSLRYFNIFGPRQNANSAYAAVIAAFAKALLSNQHPLIFGDGEQSRDFTYVHNAVHANLLAARAPKPLNGQVINVACGQRVTVNELAKLMAELLGKPHLTPTYQPDRAGDVKHSLADLTLARSVLGYTPIAGFKDGLHQTMQWYAQGTT